MFLRINEAKHLWDVPLAWIGGLTSLLADIDTAVSILVGVSVIIFTGFRIFYLVRDKRIEHRERKNA